MIGILIVSHSNISKEFLKVLEHIVGKQEFMKAISIFPKDDVEKKRKEIIESIKEVDQGSGVIILTDMFGGTPSNLAISVMEERKIEVVAGVNLPMLIKISSLREKHNIKDLISISQESGRKYMNIASAFFGESKNCKKKN
ncbi:MAG: PTS fructose transporter subunit IIA [Rickettsiales bacterium]|nr:PTS fructose transporter subunit IIA [Rickettsiales bacterium]|tara:strand:+ start:314 stop:736 length:423 start_codon:yes stop_codon:yes gene_type:complete